MEHVDIVILGSGLVGSVTAMLLKQSGLRVCIIEKASLGNTQPPVDGRTTAISYGSMDILKRAGVWEKLENHIHPIHEIRVFEAETPYTLNFLEADKRHIPHEGPLGFMIDNGILRNVLQQTLQSTDNISVLDSREVVSFTKTQSAQELTLSTGEVLSTKLIISCEGRNAPSRDHFGITVKSFEYNQTALVGTLTHTQPHNGVAFEIFHPQGPLAFLPLPDKGGQCQSALVWSSKKTLREVSDEVILPELNDIFPHLGQISLLKGKQFYPLKGQRVSSIIGDRYVLIGDAAHVLHPVAGQGVNLGWRDADQIVHEVLNTHHVGGDIGGEMLLTRYGKKRMKDQHKLFFVSDSMIRLFGIDHPFVKMVRSYGLGLVNRIPFLKRFLMKQAMGRG